MSLCLVAGTGALPRHVRDVAMRVGDAPLMVGIAGLSPLSVATDLTFRLERLGTFIADLRARGINRICFAGAVSRPDLNPADTDDLTRPLLPRMLQALGQGDGAASRALLEVFEEAGIAPIGAHCIAPDLLPQAGCLAGDVTARITADAAFATEVLTLMAPLDVAQACSIAGGRILAIETVLGTAAMLGGLAATRRDPEVNAPSGGILMKQPKPDQDSRIDLPVIGPDTIVQAVGAGLEAVVIAAGRVMVLELEATIAAARQHGLTLWVRESGAR